MKSTFEINIIDSVDKFEIVHKFVLFSVSKFLHPLKIPKVTSMSYTQTHLQKIRDRKSIVNIDINSEIKKYQQQLVFLSFSKENVSVEYYSILEKIKLLRKGILNGKLPI